MINKRDIYRKTGGFMKGVCHPGDHFDQVANAGFGWIRRDVPYPYDQNGNPTPSFMRFHQWTQEYAKRGIRTVCVSPYPSDFLENGVDVKTKEGLMTAADICRRMAIDLQDVAGCWQATNEMFVPAFRAPLTAEEAVVFVSACINGLNAAKTNALVGHNSFGFGWMPYSDDIATLCDKMDYIGVDSYMGTWSKGGADSYVPLLEQIADHCRLPVILMEFGFASRGEMMAVANGELNDLGNITEVEQKINPEIVSYFRSFGFDGVQDIVQRPDDFITTVLDRESPDMAERARYCADKDKIPYLFGSVPHLLKKWPAVCDLPHTEEGQAMFYRKLLPQLMKSPSVIGAMIYDLSDSSHCFTCGHADCPLETAWGLLDIDGRPKPAYHAVSSIFNEK